MHCYCQLAGIVNESLKPCLPQENGKKNLIFPIAKIEKHQNGKYGNLRRLSTSPASVGRPGGRSPSSSGKTSWRPFPLLWLFSPLRSRGISSSRHRRRRIEGSLLLPPFYSTYLEKNGRRKKGVGGIIIHSYTGILSFPHFLYPLEKYRPSQQGSPFRRLTTNRSCAHRPMYTRSVFSTAPHGSKPIIFSLLLFCSIVFSRRDDLEEPLLHSLCRTHASRP